jgi:hypothetical protein
MPVWIVKLTKPVRIAAVKAERRVYPAPSRTFLITERTTGSEPRSKIIAFASDSFVTAISSTSHLTYGFFLA